MDLAAGLMDVCETWSDLVVLNRISINDDNLPVFFMQLSNLHIRYEAKILLVAKLILNDRIQMKWGMLDEEY